MCGIIVEMLNVVQILSRKTFQEISDLLYKKLEQEQNKT